MELEIPNLHKALNVARHFSKPHMKRQKIVFVILVFLTHLSSNLLGQKLTISKAQLKLKINSINSYCKTVDNNRNYVEGISEGEIYNKKGGFDTYYLKDKNSLTLFRIKHNLNIEDSSVSLTMYYKNNKVIKAIINSTKTTVDKKLKSNSLIFYVDNGKIIKQVGVNYDKINVFKESKYFLKDFEKHR